MAAKKVIVAILSQIKGVDTILKEKLNDPRISLLFESDESKMTKLLETAEVVLGEPKLLSNLLSSNHSQIRWIQSTWAGVEVLMKFSSKLEHKPSYTLTRLAGVFGPLMAEYVIGYIIVNERKILELYQQQLKHEWKQITYRKLSNLRIGIMGLGDIGSVIARYASTFGMKVWGYKRNKSNSLNKSIVEEIFYKDQLNEFLRGVDYLVNTLPGTPETYQLLSGDVLSNCKDRGCVFINVGRGTIIDEESLMNALNSNWIRGAILDVFESEPLPSQSKLWTNGNNVIITPHVSAVSLPEDVCNVFQENLQRYLNQSPLLYQVNWDDGY